MNALRSLTLRIRPQKIASALEVLGDLAEQGTADYPFKYRNYAEEAAQAAAEAERREKEEHDRRRKSYEQALALLKEIIPLRTYENNRLEAFELQNLRTWLQNLYITKDHDLFVFLHGLKTTAMHLIEKKNLPTAILNFTPSHLEEMRARPWYQILEDLEREENELEKWMDYVSMCNEWGITELSDKPDYPMTYLFQAAANSYGTARGNPPVPMKHVRYAIKQYVTICKCPFWPELGDVVLLDATDLLECLTDQELKQATTRIMYWVNNFDRGD